MFSPLFLLIRFAICLLMPKGKPRKEWTLDDVKAALANKALQKSEPLNWNNSIVDLCKVLELNPSLASRREMYESAGGEGDYSGTAAQNQWLHAYVMQKLVEDGFGDA